MMCTLSNLRTEFSYTSNSLDFLHYLNSKSSIQFVWKQTFKQLTILQCFNSNHRKLIHKQLRLFTVPEFREQCTIYMEANLQIIEISVML
jgi:hypothetical protein